jgi:hypothetical protein
MSVHHARKPGVATIALALTTAVAGALPASAATGDAYGPARVTTDADARVLMAAYDPGDRLGLPGDTHSIELHYTAAFPYALSLFVASSTCGDDDPSHPPYDLDCPPVDSPAVTVHQARVDVLSATRVRIRATTSIGGLDLTLAGERQPVAGEPFVSHEWVHAVGTTREHGRTVAIDSSQATLTRATIGGLRLFQDPAWLLWSGVRTRSTTVRSGTGPAVAVPALPAPGTQDGEWRTYGTARAAWTRDLPAGGPPGTRDVEVGEVTYLAGDEYTHDVAGAHATHQRCEPGERLMPWNDYPPRRPCDVLEPQLNGSGNSSAVLDVAAGTLRVQLYLLDPATNESQTHLAFRWHGRERVGLRTVETTRFDSVARSETYTREGVRWLQLHATGTVAGDPVDTTSDLDLSVYRQKLEYDLVD